MRCSWLGLVGMNLMMTRLAVFRRTARAPLLPPPPFVGEGLGRGVSVTPTPALPHPGGREICRALACRLAAKRRVNRDSSLEALDPRGPALQLEGVAVGEGVGELLLVRDQQDAAQLPAQ